MGVWPSPVGMAGRKEWLNDHLRWPLALFSKSRGCLHPLCPVSFFLCVCPCTLVGREMHSYICAHLCVSTRTAHGLLGSVKNPVTGSPTVVFPRELSLAHLFRCEQSAKVCHFKWVDGWREEASTGKRSLPSLGGVLVDVHGTPFFQLFHISKYFQTIQKKTRAESLQVSLPATHPHAGCFASCFPSASLLFLLLPPTFSYPPTPDFQLQKPKLSRTQSKMRLTTAEAWESR